MTVSNMVIQTRTWSPFQEDIFKWANKPIQDLVVIARAGSGKTSTIVELAGRLSGEVLYLAFNREIVNEVEPKMQPYRHVTVKTTYSIGMGMLVRKSAGKKLKVDDRKSFRLASDWVKSETWDWDQRGMMVDRGKAITAIRDVVDKGRVNLIRFELDDHVWKIANKYGIDLEDWMLKGVRWVAREDERIAEQQGIIDFIDQIYLPTKWVLTPRQVDYVLIDECQDLSPAQLEIVLKCRKPGGRVVFVGDDRQAIYGFAGADVNSVENIIQRTGATTLPLSICYRCHKGAIRLAQTIVPDIKWRDDAPEGLVDYKLEDDLPTLVAEGDLVLCRLTAPLVSWCIKLIGQRIAARVRGRDIGADLVATIEAVAKIPNFSYEHFGEFLQAFLQAQVFKLKQRDGMEAYIESLEDKFAAIDICWRSFNAPTLEQLCREIQELFVQGRASVTLSTVHRAKGLEARRVFILRPDRMPLMWPGQQPEELLQEMNLRYVAFTRAKEYLCFLVDTAEQLPKSETEDDAIEALAVEDDNDGPF